MRHSLWLGVFLMMAACAKGPSQDTYLQDEVGVSRIVQFGTVVQSRMVDITGKSSNAGAILGGATGAGVGSYAGSGSGSAWATAGGAVIGAVAGAVTEQTIRDHQGVEYVITKENGKTVTLVQELGEGGRILGAGERVMIQISGSYQRVMPATQMPTAIARPKGLVVIDEPQK